MNILNKGVTALFFLMLTLNGFAQTAREIHTDNEPPNWSDPWTIAFCIVIPILLIIGGIYINNRFKKRKKDQ